MGGHNNSDKIYKLASLVKRLVEKLADVDDKFNQA